MIEIDTMLNLLQN